MADPGPGVHPDAAHALHDPPRRRAPARCARRANEAPRISLHLAEHAAERRVPRARRRSHPRVVRGAPQAAARSARVAGQVAHRARRRARRARPPRHLRAPDGRAPRRARARRAPRRARRLLPALEPLHRDALAAAPGRPRGGPLAGRSGRTRSRRTRRSTCSPRRARWRTAFRRCPRATSCEWRRGRGPGRSAAKTSGASRAARGRGSSRSTGTPATTRARSSSGASGRRAGGSCAGRARRPSADRRPGRERDRAGPHLRLARGHRPHGLRDAVRCERGRLLARRPARAAHGAPGPRDGRLHGLREDERDGVQPVGRPRRRRPEPSHPRAARPGRNRPRRRGARARRRVGPRVPRGRRAASASGPPCSRRACSSSCSATRTPSASPGGRTRGSGSRSRWRRAARGSPWGRGRARGSCC